MRKILVLLVLATCYVVSCQKDVYVTSCQDVEDDHVVSCTRSYSEALELAEEALTLLDGNSTRSAKRRRINSEDGQVVMRPLTRNGEEGDMPIMYIFNHENDEGFTIIAADRSQQALIAVTEQGSYTYGVLTGVEPFDLYMEKVASQLMNFPDPAPFPDDPVVPAPLFLIDTVEFSHSRVDAMLTTKWGQGGIYGRLCPNGLSGCSNTAAVQIMAYHRHPASLTLTYLDAGFPLTISIDWDGILHHSQGFGSYDAMSGSYFCDCGCNYGQISHIMREIGHRANTDYDPTGSGAEEPAIRDVLQNLGFGHPIHVENITFSDYQEVIFDELDNGNPLYVSGFRDDNWGHAWVIDGYEHTGYTLDYYRLLSTSGSVPRYIYDHTDEVERNLLHFNWGWNGSCDGWFGYGVFAPGNGNDYDDDSIDNSREYNYNLWINLVYKIDN